MGNISRRELLGLSAASAAGLLAGRLEAFAEQLSTVVPRTAPPRLIVRGDDMGYAHAGNEAIVKCAKEGIESSVEVIVPSPWFPEAVSMLADISSVDVGVHLALSSEWDNV